MAPSVEQVIGESFADIEAVERVHVFCDSGTYSVYTVIDDEDEAAISRIYQCERSVIRRFPELHFDFNVIARRGRPLSSIATFASPVWQRVAPPRQCA